MRWGEIKAALDKASAWSAEVEVEVMVVPGCVVVKMGEQAAGSGQARASARTTFKVASLGSPVKIAHISSKHEQAKREQF